MKLLLINLFFSILALAFSLRPSLYHHKSHKAKGSLFHVLQSRPFFRFQQSPPNLYSPDEDIGSGPIFKKGWLKFLLLSPSSNGFFTEFTKNPAFSDQKQENVVDAEKEDDCGPLDIPSLYHYYFYLTAEKLFIVSARRNSLAKTVKVLNLKHAKNEEFISSVNDQGNYQEGFCFKLDVVNCGLTENLILCSDKLNQKQEWMKRIGVLQSRCKSPEPHLVNEVMIQSHIKNPREFQSNYTELYDPPTAPKKIDGKWVILHDWSTCTLACGGGTQTLHRLCIPPTEGGSPCVGEAIVNRSCNTQACPNVRVVVDERVAPTRIKMLRISNRPQRYETCVVKEGDLEVVKEGIRQAGSERSPRIPARVVLNNKTLTVFESDDYSAILFAINIANIKTIENFREDPDSCFVIQDCTNSNRITLCGFSTSPRQRPSQQKKEWVKQIYFFRDKCQEEGYNQFTDEIFLMKKRAIEAEAMERRANHHMDGERLGKMQQKLEKLQYLAMIAAAKESKYEKMAEKEELEREEKEENELRKRYELEKIKGEMSEIHHSSHDFPSSPSHSEQRQLSDLESELESTKSELKNMLKQKRDKQEQKLSLMRSRAERHKQEILDKISLLKSKNSDSNCRHEGKIHTEPLHCTTVNETAKIEAFCDLHFKISEKLDENLSCKEKENFCFACCDVEFDGEEYDEERSACEDGCDALMISVEKERRDRKDCEEKGKGRV